MLDDKDAQATSHEARLLLSDGTGNSADILLGDLVDNGDGSYALTGKVLWPGATVDGDGNATGWSGWELVDGVWHGPSSVNEGWVRGDITAVISVNPQVTVDLSYPDATPECDGPKEVEVLPSLTVTNPTCLADGAIATPTNGDGYTFTGWKGDKAPKGAGTFTAVYSANPGKFFPGGSVVYEITKTVKSKLSGESCGSLAQTGVTTFGTALAAGALLLLMGCGTIVGTIIWRRRKAV